MSSLLKNHVARKSCRKEIPQRQCWEFLDCPRVLCPAHGNENSPCWLIPRTHCHADEIKGNFFQKIPSCLSCSYFNARVAADPRGKDRFLGEQLQRYNFRALERIYQKEESFVDILNRLPDGLFTTDEEWRITYFNPAAEKITGFSAADAVGMYCKDVFKNSVCETACALKRAVAEGRDIHNQEYEITNIAGVKIPIMCSTSAFRDPQGRITGGLEIFKDITELKQLQQEVAAREKKYARIFEGSHDMIFVSSQNGRIIDVNPAGVDMLGYRSKEEFLNLLSARRFYLRPEYRDKFAQLMEEKGQVKDFETDFKRRDGTPVHVLISGRRYENPLSGDIEYEGIIKDITARKKAEESLRERNRELSILNSIAVGLNLTMDLGHILDVTLKNILKVLRLQTGYLFLIDHESKQIRPFAWQTRKDFADPARLDLSFKDQLLFRSLMRDSHRLPPASAFPPFQVFLREPGGGRSRRLSCHLISFKGKAVGFFAFHLPRQRVLSQHENDLLGSLGNFLGGAIENNQLLETIRQHRQELRRLTERLFESQENERRRIARELHDEAGQSLTAVNLALERLVDKVDDREPHLRTEIEEIRRMVLRTSSEIRHISYRLHPTLLIDLGLEPALQRYFSEVERHSGLDIEFHMVGFNERLGRDLETVLYRFCQETLNNTLKHSGAENFRVSIIKSYPKIIFLAEDDGIGFDGQISNRDTPSLGLLGMRERASFLGGRFLLRSLPGEGTRIRIEIPLKESDAHGNAH